jgi:4-amino-4-deoxy-L-arabinose transferase-like glycosyltransferase
MDRGVRCYHEKVWASPPAGLRGEIPAHPAWFVLVAALYFWNLGVVELSDVDEARSGVVVRDILERGRWMLPRTPDGYLNEKPPAYFAASAVLVRVLGRGEWVLRTVSVLAALGTLGVVLWLTRIYGTPRAAAIAALALASNIIFMRWARQAMVDMLLSFFLTLGLAAYFAARAGRLGVWRAAALSGLSFALAALSKGPIGIAFPLAVIGGDALLTCRGQFWRLSLPWGPGILAFALAIGIPLAWYLPGYFVGGDEFLKTCLIGENFNMPFGKGADPSTPIIVSHRKPLLYYVGNQAILFLPLLPLLPEAVRWLADPRSSPARWHLLAWAGFGFLFFFIPRNQRYYYLLPLQPAVAMAIGLAADGTKGEAPVPRTLIWGARVSSVVLALSVPVCVLVAVGPGIREVLGIGTIGTALAAHLGAILIFAFFGLLLAVWLFLASGGTRTDLLRPVLALGLFAIAGRSFLEAGVWAETNGMKPFVAGMQAKMPPGARPVILPPLHSYALDFYWPDPLPRPAAGDLGPDAYVFVQRDHLKEVGEPAREMGIRRYGTSAHDVLLVHRP